MPKWLKGLDLCSALTSGNVEMQLRNFSEFPGSPCILSKQTGTLIDSFRLKNPVSGEFLYRERAWPRVGSQCSTLKAADSSPTPYAASQAQKESVSEIGKSRIENSHR